jgi:hypothetical protein
MIKNQAAGHPLGFINPVLYSLAGSSSFTHVTNPSATVAMVRVDYVNGVDASNGTTVSLRTANQTLSLATTPGWDDVTGPGTRLPPCYRLWPASRRQPCNPYPDHPGRPCRHHTCTGGRSRPEPGEQRHRDWWSR